MYLLTAAKRTTTAKATDGQNKQTIYTVPAHHVTQTNLLKSAPFTLAINEYNDGTVTMSLSKLFQVSVKTNDWQS